jgi:outer membrane immunogenic protein
MHDCLVIAQVQALTSPQAYLSTKWATLLQNCRQCGPERGIIRMYGKCCKVVGCVLLAAAAAPAANAADLYRNPPPAVAYVPPIAPTNTWAGFYLGINGGYGWGAGGDNFTYGNVLHRAQPEGGFGGGQLGYNFQSGSFVYGVETDFQGSDISDSVTGARYSSRERMDWFGTARGRLGFALDRALVYGTGGFAYGDVKQHAVIDGTSFDASDATRTGFTLGGGIEYKLNNAWSLKAEYQYLDFGSEKLTDTAGVAPTSDLDTNYHTARIGLNYRFGGGGYEPLK